MNHPMSTIALRISVPLLLIVQPSAPRAQDMSVSSTHRAAYAAAVQSFRGHAYAGAYGRFARLADAGHAPSAQLALVMVRNGPSLFGSAWAATPEQLRHWNALVVNDARRRVDAADDERGD